MARARKKPETPWIEPYFRALPGREGFLRAIADEPDEDVHRLALADWLEEHGEAERSEFIRLQCRVADIPEESPCPRALHLLVSHRKRWAKGIGWVGFHRGMAETLWLSGAARDWLQLLSLAQRKHHVRRVSADLCHADWAVFAREVLHGDLRLTGLRVCLDNTEDVRPLDVAEIQDLVTAPCFASLRVLEIQCHGLTPAAARRLASADLSGLRGLSLRCGMGEEGMTAFVRRCRLSSVRHLDLCYSLGREGAAAFASHPVCPNVEHLDLSHGSLGDVGVAALAASPHLHRLRSLNLRQNGVGPEGAATLTRLPLLDRLASLGLSDNRVGEGVVELARSPRSAGLEHLDLSKNSISADCAHGRRTAPRWSRLRSLGLGYNEIDNEALAALTVGLTRIEGLGLAHNWIGAAGLKALTNNADLSNLTHLDLGDNPLRNEGGKVIAGCAALGKLESLTLHSCDIGPEGMLALAGSPHLNRLIALDVRHNRVGKEARAALNARFRAGRPLLPPARVL